MQNNPCTKNFVSDIIVHSCDDHVIFEAVNKNIQGDRIPEHICITNTESMYFAEKLQEHKDYINSSAFSLCDGMGSVIAGKFQGEKIRP